MATIEHRGPHQWRVLIRRRGFPLQSKTFGTKAEADAWAKMIESEMSRGIWLDRSEAESTTLAQLLDRYESEIVPAKKGAVREVSILRLWRATPLAVRKVASIRSGDIAQQRDAWLSAALAPATVLRRLALLSHLFNTARREWHFESLANPVDLIRKPSPNNARTRRLVVEKASKRSFGVPVEDELAQIIRASESLLLPKIICVSVETAMRRSEIASLRWENIDLSRRVAHLPDTKNGNARDVPLSQAATDAIASLLPERPRGAGPAPAIQGLVFAIHPDGITQAFERALLRAREAYEQECKVAGTTPSPRFLTDLRFHDLRHEATSRLASKFQLHELAKITGHRDPRMLLRYYHPDVGDFVKRLD